MGSRLLMPSARGAPLRHIPILFITASVQRGQIAELRARGAADHLEKPFSPVALREKIDELLSKPAWFNTISTNTLG
jgi:CheY-like chemotaxis protein